MALTIAFPISLAMAVLATEFSLGVISRAMSAMLDALSGIPPVVYGLLSLVFVQQFMKPKFCGTDIPPETQEYIAGQFGQTSPQRGVPKSRKMKMANH